MKTKKIQINASPHPGQKAVHENPARFKVLAAGRRWGKTRLGVNECLGVAAAGGRAWWVAPTYKMAAVGWRPLHRMGIQIGAEVRRVDRQIMLPNGGEVTVRSADNPDTLRGEGLDFAVLDECAFISESAWTEAIRPALSDRKGKAMFISTPKGRNWFFRLYQHGQTGDPAWQSWKLPTEYNPHIDKEEIEAARQSLPEMIFRQEYLAQFLENEGAVFRNISNCMDADKKATIEHHTDYDERGEIIRYHNLMAGIDWGKQNDFTVISIGCADCNVEVARDRFNQIDYSFQRKRIMSLLDEWKVNTGLAETNAMGDPILEQLQADGAPLEGFQTTAQTKPQLIENLALALEREEWQFQEDPIWTGELEAYERKISATTGRSSYSAPEGLHDDTVIARALMVMSGTYGYHGIYV